MFKKFNNLIFVLMISVMSSKVYALGLETAARNLTRKTTDLTIAMVPVGIIIGGMLMVFGKEEGKERIGHGIIALIVVIAAPSIVSWIQSAVR